MSADDRAAAIAWYGSIDPEHQKRLRELKRHSTLAPKPKTEKALICGEGIPALRLHTQGGDFLEQTHFLKRGDPSQKGAIATQSFLQLLMRASDKENQWREPPPAGAATSFQRRALANWITDVDNGAGALLARVIVNRLWHYHFGRGIVATPSDFGAQGDPPTHPELLDWLAGELIRNQWRLKPIHKLILTSAVFAESSEREESKLAIDPANRFCWRFSRRRLEGEVIRDSLLATSGLLDRSLYGPGSLDRKHKRRSVYFTIKRSQLAPMMVLFDGPDGLQGLASRQSTTIAPQALAMMNDPLVRDCALALARRIRPDYASNKSVSHDALVRSGYRLALGRQPYADELSESIAFLGEQANAYRNDGAADPEILAIADFCQTLFALNEFVYQL